MKKVIKVLLAIVVVIVIALFGAYAYYGGFISVKFEVKETGGETLVYEEMTGDYAQTPMVMDKVYQSLLKDFNMETTKGIGIYLDNPETVDKSMLRSEIGCVLDATLDSTKLAAISAKFKVKALPKTSYIVTNFPNKGMMSVMVGIMKIYPALNDYVKANGYVGAPVIEIYDTPNKVIEYRMEASK